MGFTIQDPEQLVVETGIYRAAFPAYRVFIYGYEITEDVVEVRVNQSGGSAERMAGSCSITLLNKFDKYIINHSDMKAIGKSRNALKQEYDAKIKQAVDNSIYAFESSAGLAKALADDEKAVVESLLSQGYSEDQTVQMVAKLHEIEDSTKGDLAVAWDDAYIPGWYKREILGKKMSYSQEVKEVQDTNLVRYKAETLFDYPMQEGDCIFHANDPVRIVFRDPFDPRVWHWRFAGFLDTFTENVSNNNESVLTLSCTDVSKMARYSLIHINTGLQDINLVEQELENMSTVNISLYQDFLGNLTLFEILETVFYGSKSLQGVVKESTQSRIVNMSQEEIINYMFSNFKMDSEEATFGDIESWRSRAMDLMVSRKLDTLSGLLQGRELGAVSSPRGVKFRRKSDRFGVTAYFLGTPDSADLEIGSAIKDLGQWNEILHHRVRESDLTSMSVDGDIYFSGDPTIDNIIYTIGTDLEHYPVGGGRVYCLLPANLGSNLGRNVMDKTLIQSISFHSTFRDRLSLIYDVAERIDFRFYATPKGDLVFEMPFYDFNPEFFATGNSIIDTGFDRSAVIQKYEDVFDQAYSGKYGDSAQALTSLQIQTEAEGSNFDIIDYSKQPVFDYGKEFVIEQYDQYGYSNTSTDEGVITAYTCIQRTVSSNNSLQNENIHAAQKSVARGLIPTLGFRVGSGDPWGYVDTAEGAEAYSALSLNRVNAEARNLSINTSPKFGLMVNRPLFWRTRNYYANIVSLSDSIVWMGDCTTTINLNQVRGWTGDMDSSGNPLHTHFGGNRAFNLAEFLQQYLTKGKTTQG